MHRFTRREICADCQEGRDRAGRAQRAPARSRPVLTTAVTAWGCFQGTGAAAGSGGFQASIALEARSSAPRTRPPALRWLMASRRGASGTTLPQPCSQAKSGGIGPSRRSKRGRDETERQRVGGLRAAIERIEQARAAGIHPARITRPGVMACGRVTGSRPGRRLTSWCERPGRSSAWSQVR